MRDLQHAAQVAGSRHGAAHPLQIGLATPLGHQRLVGLGDAVLGPPDGLVDRVLIEAHDPVRQCQGDTHQFANRHPAGEFAGGVSTHAVGDDQGVPGFIGPIRHFARRQARPDRLEVAADPRDEEVVLVGRANVTGVRESERIDEDGRIEREIVRRRADERRVTLLLRTGLHRSSLVRVRDDDTRSTMGRTGLLRQARHRGSRIGNRDSGFGIRANR